MFKKIALIAALSAFSATAWAATNPTEVKIKVYGVAISANADCSDASVVGYDSAGVVHDFKAGATLFSGAVAAGTYKCVILYMDSVINFKPLADDNVGCVAGTSYHTNVCNTGNGCNYTTASPNASNVLVFGASAAASTASTATSGDKVLLFLSTGSTATSDTADHAFEQPVAAHLDYGINLASAFVVSDTGSSGTFVANFDGKVSGSGSASDCSLQAPVFSFR
jgi:hypothetical protein